jgi:hypothetical protein
LVINLVCIDQYTTLLSKLRDTNSLAELLYSRLRIGLPGICKQTICLSAFFSKAHKII